MKCFYLQSGVPLYKALREKAKKRPESIGVDGIINPTKLILEGKYAYTFVSDSKKLFKG